MRREDGGKIIRIVKRMSMIRVLFCTLLAAWAVLPLRADDRGRALVRSLSAKIASYVSYEVSFTADSSTACRGVS